uniref:uncharacterized protein LOC120328750 n=1 Tax=Styela clava TaxID=7725 RepID=UPI00193AD69A|nr:uncharacterized protein LOC120328750 [Styela clava]
MIKYKFALLSFFCLLECIPQGYGHSWLACTDYAEKNGRYYDDDLCRGYARSANELAPRGGTFGLDKGFDYHPIENQPCKTSRNDGTEYDADHRMAVYYPGQQVVLAHPMKNHGSDTCTSRYIPDTGNFIYRGGLNDESDLTLSQFRAELVADLGVKDPPDETSNAYTQYPKPGYQNAPAFCEDTGLSLGTYSFNVPSDLQPGQYTFLWLWEFNNVGDIYTSCFEVNIVSTLAERNSMLSSYGLSNFYEPCGGLTSNFGIAGNTNPGCTETDTGITTSTSTTTTTAPATVSTSSTTTTTTTTPAPGETLLAVQTSQMGGEINLPLAESGTMRRYISVHWDCPVIASFWNIRVTGYHDVAGSGGVHYDLLHEGNELDSGKFYYHAMFTQPCHLETNPPIATLIRDEA